MKRNNIRDERLDKKRRDKNEFGREVNSIKMRR